MRHRRLNKLETAVTLIVHSCNQSNVAVENRSNDWHFKCVFFSLIY